MAGILQNTEEMVINNTLSLGPVCKTDNGYVCCQICALKIMSAISNFRRVKLWKHKQGLIETLSWNALVIRGKFAFHLGCLKKSNYLFVHITGYGMEKAYLQEANTKFGSSTINVLTSIRLELKLPLIQMMKFRNLLKYVIPKCMAYY